MATNLKIVQWIRCYVFVHSDNWMNKYIPRGWQKYSYASECFYLIASTFQTGYDEKHCFDGLKHPSGNNWGEKW